MSLAGRARGRHADTPRSVSGRRRFHAPGRRAQDARSGRLLVGQARSRRDVPRHDDAVLGRLQARLQRRRGRARRAERPVSATLRRGRRPG
ncbi:MAG: hypothetical protein MZV64_13660 [Ignavibacteriales bacterium]|nr:hypothetical protein [Ignavibacteriales bacterium]